MLSASFVPAADGRRFLIHHPPGSSVARGAVVYLHPFADEMNKSRRMAATFSRMLAAAGHEVVQIDHRGCGDSSGDFGEAGWDDWVDDALLAVDYLRQRTRAPLWLWGLRTGCLVACAAARRIAEPAGFLFWQPPASGRHALQQFLRIGVAGEMLGGDGKGALGRLRQELAAGRAVEVAGYTLAPGLAAGLESAELSPAPQARRLVWMEVGNREGAEPAPWAQAIHSAWRGQGAVVTAGSVVGPQFWQTVEIEDAPQLLAASLDALLAEPASSGEPVLPSPVGAPTGREAVR